MTSNNFDQYLTDPNTPNIVDILHSLLMSILSISMLLIASIIMLTIIFVTIKYRNANFLKSILVQNSLQKEHYDQSKVQIKGNLVVRGTIVQYDQNEIKIIVPTKFIWQITSKLDLVKEIQIRIRSPEFNTFLASNFEDFTFSEPIYKSNHYIINGTHY